MAKRSLIGDVNPDVFGGGAAVPRTEAFAAADALLLRPTVYVADEVAAAAGAAAGAVVLRRGDGKLCCQRSGCGALYTPDDNRPDACSYHPGHAIFVGAVKEWSCCHARATGYAEFAALKGCAAGLRALSSTPL